MHASVKIVDHMSLEQVMEKMQMTSGSLQLQKWLVIYNAIVDPRPLSKIAMHTGLTEATVHKAIADYNLLGPQALKGVSISVMETRSAKRCGPMMM